MTTDSRADAPELDPRVPSPGAHAAPDLLDPHRPGVAANVDGELARNPDANPHPRSAEQPGRRTLDADVQTNRRTLGIERELDPPGGPAVRVGHDADLVRIVGGEFEEAGVGTEALAEIHVDGQGAARLDGDGLLEGHGGGA